MSGSASIGGVYDSARIGGVSGSARIEDVWDDAKIERAEGSAIISTIGPETADWNNKAALVLSENATYRNCIERTIYQSGGWKLALVAAGATIGGGQA